MSISDNIQKFKEQLPEGVTLVAISKTKPEDDIQEAYDTGHKVFGENKVQELAAKQKVLPKDIEWHMVGHMQRNKVKQIASFVHLIHGVDSLKLLEEINKHGAKHNRVINCLLQIHIAEEKSKFGLNYRQAEDILQSEALKKLAFVHIRGLMGMATYSEDEDKVSKEFRRLAKFHAKWKANDPTFDILSMGMSGDYHLALEEGSTMIRVGSAIFGERN